MNECDTCAYNEYDEEWGCYICTMNLDEDDYARFMQDSRAHCPFYRDGDEYKIAGKQ